jgi:competence protein ComEC
VIARFVYRRIDLNNIIAVAAALLIFLDPGNLYDVGFQLSFAVTWGLILFLPHFNRLFTGMKMPGLISYPLLVACSSVIATVISAPITGYYFGEISLVTVASNLLVVPMVSLAVVGSIILLLTTLMIPAVAMIPGMALDRLLGAIHIVVAWFGRWEFAEAHIGSFSAVYVYLMLGGAILALLAISYRFMRLLLVVFLLGVGGFVSVRVLSADDTVPHVEIFNLETCRVIIIAEGEGALVYQQRENTGYDAFTHDLLPYLMDHYPSLPRYFIFVEPAYRTEFHLAETSEEPGKGQAFIFKKNVVLFARLRPYLN